MANKEFQVRHGLVVNGSINVTNQVNIAGVSVTEQFQTINTYMTSAAAAGNSYAENVGVSANSYASEIVSNTSFVLSTNMANNALAANNYAGAMANSANVFTSSVYDVTNVAFGHSNTTYAAVNSAFAVINAAFASANNVAPQVKPAFDTANAGYNQANTATGIANYGAELANANYIRLSAAYDVTNSAYTLANADSVRLSAGYTVANAAFDLANTKFSSSGGTVSGSVSIVGDLIISGNTIQVGAETLRVSDPLIYLAGNNYSSDIVDIGFIANYVNTGGANVHTGLYREHENKEYYLFQGYAAEPINNHIGAMSNNMTLSVLNADLRTSNLNLGGANAITWISSGYGVANASFDKANSIAISANAYTAATYAPLTGTGASGTWSINITGTSRGVGTSDPAIGAGGLWVTTATGLNIARNGTSYIALDAGNYSSYVLPLSGGTVSGATRIGTTANETLRFGQYGTLLSSDTHLSHNIYYNSGWTVISNTVPSSSIKLGSTTSNQIDFMYAAANSVAIAGQFSFNSAGVGTATGSWRSPVFYDSNDTTYYIDGNSTSNLYGLTVNQTITGSITGNAGTATSSPLLSALGAYVWDASSLATAFNVGIQSSFVSAAQGFQSYGSVMTMRTYSGGGGGGSLQLYVPYGSSYGGSSLQVRFADYTANTSAPPWTSWKTLLDSANYSSYALPLSGGTVTGPVEISTGTSRPLRLTTSSSGPWALSLYRSDVASDIMVFNNNGYWYFGQYCYAPSFRAPIFYDSDNTGYYVDPTSSTSIRTAGAWHSDSGSWTGEFSGKIQYHSNHWYVQGADLFIWRNSGGSNVAYFNQNGYLYAPFWYDSNDTGYYVDPNSHSYFYSLRAASYLASNGNIYTDNNYGYGHVGVYASTRYQGVFAMGDAYKLPADGTTTGNLYGIAWSHPNTGGAAGNLASHGMLILENGTFQGAWGGGRLVTPSDVRGTLFYDYNDTGYYADPNSTSSFNTINYYNLNYQGNTDYGFKGTNVYADTINSGAVGDPLELCYHRGAYTTTSGSMRAPIFYDSNDTSYYADPNSTSQFSSILANNWFRPQGQTGLYSQSYGQHFYAQSNGLYWCGASTSTTGGMIFRVGHEGTVRGYVYHDGSENFGFLHKDGNWAVRTTPSVTEIYNVVYTGDTRATILYDRDNTSYYFGDSQGNALFNYATIRNIRMYGVGGDSGASVDGYGIYQEPGAWTHPYPDLVVGWHTGVKIGGYYGYNGTRFYNNNPASGSLIASIGDGDNAMRSYDNIIAYASDKRLKENIVNIPNAIEKIMTLNGVTFDWKDMVKDLGFEPSTKHEAGVLAQEVEAVLPEAVEIAPFDYDWKQPGKSKSGEKYLTVKYEKIVPLLIEGMKDQQRKIDKLEKMLEEFLNGKI